MRNNRRKKIMGGLLCILLASCTAEEKKEIRPEEPHEETAVVIDGSHAVPPKSKEERITVHTDASGKVLKQSAEYTIKADGTEVIRDTTFLKDLINTSGDEEFMTEDDTHVLFENFGKEITVSGTCDEPVPVSVQITYLLDGKEIRPEDLAGKSGHAVIRFAYENHTDIPFVILTAVPLSASHFSNISGTNARIVSMGDTVFAAGIVLPGWADRLHPEKIKEDLELPEYIEIEADTDSFELDFTASVVTGGLLKDIEDEDMDSLDDLDENIGKIEDALDDLADGGRDLYNGADTFRTYLNKYTDGVSALGEGTKQLYDGMREMNANASKLEEGASSISSGLRQADSFLKSLDPSAIAEQLDPAVREQFIQAKEALIRDIEDLKKQTDSFLKDEEAVRAYLDSCEKWISDVSAVMEQLKQLKLPSAEAVREDLKQAEQAMEQIQPLLENEALSEEEKSALKTLMNSTSKIHDDLAEAESLMETISAVLQKIQAVPAVPEEINSEEMLKTAEDIAEQLKILAACAGENLPDFDLKALLDQASEMRTGIHSLAEGSASLESGIAAFHDAAGQMENGMKSLQEGSAQVSSGGIALKDGYAALFSGISQFKDGLNEFRNEGKKQIADLHTEDLSSILKELKEMRNRDLSWKGHTGCDEKTECTTVFIIESESIR